MRFSDLLGLTLEALRSHRLRYGLSALAIAVGVAAVVLLASIGEGTRRYIMNQMSQFGSTIVAINPGKIETGGIPGMLTSHRKLTLDDARALGRIPAVTGVVAMSVGSADVQYESLSRQVDVYGVTADMPRGWSMPVSIGEFIPDVDVERGSAVVVLGPRVKRELFGNANALGQPVRIGDARFRVIGIMESKGQYLGFDLDDAAYIPIASAMRLFNRPEVDEIDLLVASHDEIDPVAERARAMLTDRHDGEEDFTLTTQAEAQGMVNRILGIISAVVTAIAGISLLVGAIGILTIMWIVVQERVNEIGLVKAIGAHRRQIMIWYLFEAAVTALAGGVGGLAIGLGGAWALQAVVPGLSVYVPLWIVAAALVMALGVGLAAGVAPARRAAAMDPVEALRAE
jgi:putative ABC transport system permease protein